ncbi:hypothetical protein LCGC14_2372430, partial [marine sediment metagenome]
AMGYRPEGMIADMIFPVVNVGKQSDLFPVFSRARRLRAQSTLRARGTPAKMVDEPVGSSTYFANNYALKAGVFLEDRANADPILLDEIINGRTRLVMDDLFLDWELRVANLVTSGSNVGSFTAVSSAWDGAGDPIGDLNTAIDNVQDTTGKRPTRVVMGLAAWKSFRRDSTVRNLIFGTNNGGGFASRAQVMDLFELDELLIGGAYVNTGEEFAGAPAINAGEVISQIWNDDVLIYHAPPTPSRDTPSLGYSFRWAAPGLPNMQVERHPFDTKTKSEEIEVGYYQDELITGAEYGFLLESVNSST